MLKRMTIGLVLLVGLCFGAGRRPGAVFLMIWPGSRPTALGGAFSAIADDASAAYYNPAGLGFQQNIVISGTHVNWLPELAPDMYYEYLAVSAPFTKVGTFAFNGIYLTTGETVVQNESGTVIGTYTTFDFSLGLAYGRELTPSFSVGGGLKLIYSFLAPEWVLDRLGIDAEGSALTWATDAGVLYRPFRRLHLGAALQNLGPPISFSSTSGGGDPLPLMLRLAASYKPLSILSKDTTKEQFEIVGLRLTGDITKVLIGMFPYDTPEVDSIPFFKELGYEIEDSWRSLGMEVSIYREILTLRVGYFFDKNGARGGFVLEDQNNSTEHVGLFPLLFGAREERKLTKVGITFGAGIKYAGFQLDVGVDELIYDFKTPNRKFSLTYTF